MKFNGIYKIPVLMIVGWRGHGGKPNDAPEHWIMGEKTPKIIQDLGFPLVLIEEEDIEDIELIKNLDK